MVLVAGDLESVAGDLAATVALDGALLSRIDSVFAHRFFNAPLAPGVSFIDRGDAHAVYHVGHADSTALAVRLAYRFPKILCPGSVFQSEMGAMQRNHVHGQLLPLPMCAIGWNDGDDPRVIYAGMLVRDLTDGGRFAVYDAGPTKEHITAEIDGEKKCYYCDPMPNFNDAARGERFVSPPNVLLVRTGFGR